jgi:transcriptional regulator with XRE-family HTH domain
LVSRQQGKVGLKKKHHPQQKNHQVSQRTVATRDRHADRLRMPKRHVQEPLLRSLAAMVQARRMAMGLSREQFAEQLGTDAKNVYRLERGEENVGVLRLARIADVLGLDPSALLGRPRQAERWMERLLHDGWTLRPAQARGPGLEVLDLRPQAGSGVSQPEPQRVGWAEPPRGFSAHEGLFLAQIRGDSMLPELQDGQWAVFTRLFDGARLIDERVLVREDDATGLASWVVKVVHDQVVESDDRVRLTLHSRNPLFADRDVVLDPSGDTAVVALLLRTLTG